MTTHTNIVNVLIASPGDTATFRDVVELALHAWNGDRALNSGAILLPRRWETNAVPLLTGGDGQTVINSQLVDEADIVIGVFHLKLGNATPRAASGTAEELGRAHAAGKPVHIYFSDQPLPRDFDRDAFDVLEEFKKDLRNRGLYNSFVDDNDLREKVRRAIEFDLGSLNLASPPRPLAGAALRARYLFDREPDSKGRLHKKRERIEVTNDGTVLAEGVVMTLTSNDEYDLPIVHGSTGPFSVAPNGGTFSVSILGYGATTTNADIAFTWTETGVEKSSRHTLSLT